MRPRTKRYARRLTPMVERAVQAVDQAFGDHIHLATISIEDDGRVLVAPFIKLDDKADAEWQERLKLMVAGHGQVQFVYPDIEAYEADRSGASRGQGQ